MAAVDRCVQCGKTDDHPKVHIGDGLGAGGADSVRSAHLDCLPADLREALMGQHGEAIAAAESGTHGDDLRALMLSQVSV